MNKKAEEIEIEIDAVKIIGKVKGIKESVELLMDKKTFFEWRDKLKLK